MSDVNFYASKPMTDALVAEITDQYPTYLSAIATASGMTLRPVETVKVSIDYTSKGIEKPCILIDPRRLDIEDETSGRIGAIYTYDIVIGYDGFDEEEAADAVQLYADAFVSMVVSDDYFSGQLDHASVKNIEYYPGGSLVSRYAVLQLELTLEIER